MNNNSQIEHNLKQVLNTIRELEEKYHRPHHSVQLLAVSKTKPIEDILTAYDFGQNAFGENYVQEAIEKIEKIRSLKKQSNEYKAFEWHFIGPLQKNKTRLIAENFDWIHSVDRQLIAKRLSDQRPSNTKPLQVCIQVNIDQEETKSGVNIDEIQSLATMIAELKNLKLRGLMAIPQVSSDTTQQHKSFARLRQLLELLNRQGFDLDTLSMGMSSDLEAAIAEGATIVRIGTAIFGKREEKSINK